jgi:AraC-like DNA-binding protein
LPTTALSLRPGRAGSTARGRSMIVTPDRIVYSGLLGAPTCRMHGALTVYLAHETPFEISIDGRPRERAWLAVVPPNHVHEIASPDRLVRDILLEPESIPTEALVSLAGSGHTARPAEYRRLRQAFDSWLDGREFTDPSAAELDQFFFGRSFAPRVLDARIKRVVQRIRAQPHEQFSAAECARLTGLSFSRFVHLFKQEIGMTFRAFCAWKRARAVLPSMTGQCNLTQLALEAGYPDSTHFSHSIRRIFGLRPRDILAGSRRLALCYTHDEGSVRVPGGADCTPATRARAIAAYG